jgi:flagellar biosynthesis protein FlhF
MHIRSYRARTIQEAVELIRGDLGPEAVVLHTREAPRGLLARLLFGRRLEVTATRDANVPSRFANRRSEATPRGAFASLLAEDQSTVH